MKKIISFMHISLDGFVAGPNGEMNWIKVDEEIFDFVGKRISESDTALYGRVTYEMMENYWPAAGEKPGASKHDKEHSGWYNKAHKVVLSKTMKDAALTNTTIISDNLSDSINEIKQSRNSGSNEILLFGSPTATHSLLELNLIDGYWLFVNPVILGRGIPLFANIKDKIKLQLLTTRQFTCGVTELNYSGQGCCVISLSIPFKCLCISINCMVSFQFLHAEYHVDSAQTFFNLFSIGRCPHRLKSD